MASYFSGATEDEGGLGHGGCSCFEGGFGRDGVDLNIIMNSLICERMM
jgi:hypothetical protein